MNHDPGHDEWSNNGADIRARVEYSGRERSFFLREPFGNALDAGRKNAGFAETQRASGDHEPRKRIRDRMSHRREAPENHGDGITDTSAEAVNQAAYKNHAHGVGRLKSEHEISVVDIVPAKIVLEGALENAEDLAVHVILGYTEKQERADDPAEPSGEDARFVRVSKRCG